MALEDDIIGMLAYFSTSQEEIDKIGSLLSKLKAKHQPTYEHCLRVGLKSKEAANCLSYNEEQMFYAGLLHDIGKINIPLEILEKHDGFGKEDYKVIENHPLDGYKMAKLAFPFAAEIILRHHRCGNHPYPKTLPDEAKDSLFNNLHVCRYARLLSVVDFYDAMITRHDSYQFRSRSQKQSLIKARKGMKNIIEKLYRNGIFK